MNKKGFIDLDEISPGMIILPVLAFVIAIIVAKRMEAGLLFRLIIGLVAAMVAYGIAWFSSDR